MTPPKPFDHSDPKISGTRSSCARSVWTKACPSSIRLLLSEGVADHRAKVVAPTRLAPGAALWLFWARHGHSLVCLARPPAPARNPDSQQESRSTAWGDRRVERPVHLQPHAGAYGVIGVLTLTDPVTTSLELEVGPAADMSLATRIREFLANTYHSLIADDNAEFLITLAAHELVENIIKYGASGPRRLTVQLDSRKREVRVVTANEATPAQIVRLRSKMDRICDTTDPEHLYDQFIAESADTEESGLGLIRIRAEADMDLSYEVVGQTVRIQATMRLPEPRVVA